MSAVPRLRSPIVLVHGLFGFDRLHVGPLTLFEYFRHIPAALRAGGNRVLVARLSPTGGVEMRARQLKQMLDREVPHEPVHLIAHSLGGLDSRYLITHLGMAPRVLSLTTIGTPHRGTSFADWGVKRFARLVGSVFEFANVSYQAFFDLTRESCRRFNDATPDVRGVRYFSVAGRMRPRWQAPYWWPSWRVVESAEETNDGVVSVKSAQWGEWQDVWDGDHFELVNWPWPLASRTHGDDRVAEYVNLVRRLAEEGF